MQYQYNIHKQRSFTQYRDNNSGEYKTKYYVGGNYELEDNNGRIRGLNYIYTPDGLVSIVETDKQNEIVATNYIYNDHLGSIYAITDQKGKIINHNDDMQIFSYDAWGNRRAYNKWTKSSTTKFYLFDRGYTGHQMLDEFGIIEMNGRIYDPVIGRFFSPDPFVQSPDNTQNFNRYSYVLNNPLKYTDPSGEFFIVDDAILGLIGGTINVISNLGSINSIVQGAAYFGVGFVGGALSTYITPMGSAAIVGGGNAALGSYNTTGHIDAGAVIQGAVSSAIISGITMGTGQFLGPAVNKAFSGLSRSPVLQTAITQGIIGLGVGSVGGGLGAAMSGGNVLLGMGQGALWGLGMGLATGAYTGYINAKAIDQNPWNGQFPELKRMGLKPAPYLSIRTSPVNLPEKLTMMEAKSGQGRRIMKNKINDKRYQAPWVKMRHTKTLPDGMGAIEIHYWKNTATGVTEGYKYKNIGEPFHQYFDRW